MLIYFLLQKSWFIWSTNNTLRFSSEYYICHFHFFWPKILHIIFTPKAIRCYGLFSKLISFIVDCVFFIFCNLAKYFRQSIFNTLNSNYNNLFEISSISDFLADFLMCLCILFISWKMLKSFLSGLILINTQSMFSNAFCLWISLLKFFPACPN